MSLALEKACESATAAAHSVTLDQDASNGSTGGNGNSLVDLDLRRKFSPALMAKTALGEAVMGHAYTTALGDAVMAKAAWWWCVAAFISIPVYPTLNSDLPCSQS